MSDRNVINSASKQQQSNSIPLANVPHGNNSLNVSVASGSFDHYPLTPSNTQQSVYSNHFDYSPPTSGGILAPNYTSTPVINYNNHGNNLNITNEHLVSLKIFFRLIIFIP